MSDNFKKTLQLSTLFFTTLLVSFKTNAQQSEAPDYELIKKNIQDETSTYFYPKLESRLLKFDTTLNHDEYRHLYFGYLYHKDYQPYARSKYETELNKYYQSENLSEKERDKVIELDTKVIQEFPFDLRHLNFLAYMYHLNGNEEMAMKVSHRFQSILRAIMSTGDGQTCETSFHVISTGHEYVLLNMFRFQSKGQSLTGDCDLLHIEKDERNIEGIYFNVKMLMSINLERMKKKG